MLEADQKELARLSKPSVTAIALTAALAASLAYSSAMAETVTKEKVEAALPRLEELAKHNVASGGVPGLAIAVVYKDEVVYLGGFGRREEGEAG